MVSAFAPGVGQGTALRPLSGCSCSFCSFAKNPNGVFRIAAGGSRNGGLQFKLFFYYTQPVHICQQFFKKNFSSRLRGPLCTPYPGRRTPFLPGRRGPVRGAIPSSPPAAGDTLPKGPPAVSRCGKAARRAPLPGPERSPGGTARPLPADGVCRRVTPSWRLPPSPSSPVGRAARRPAGWACA